MGGVVLAIQAVTAHRRAKAMEKTARAQVDATEQQAKTNENAERGLRQERLKNAIEHIGHKSDSVRLGGAYELFHLAEDNQELRRTVLDVLCAHVRRMTSGDAYRKDYPEKPSEEIQSLLTLLFTQEHDGFAGFHIHLAGSWLNGANLQNARLGGANLWNTQLQGAILFGAQLQEADLQGAQLQEANLSAARLQGANLWETQLQGANLQGAKLQAVVSEGIWDPFLFVERIKSLVGGVSALSGVIFGGGLTRGDVDSILEGLSNERAQVLRKKLEPHIDKPPSHDLPKDSGAETGAYTPEQAEAWIAEYEKATPKIPKPETGDKGGG